MLFYHQIYPMIADTPFPAKLEHKTVLTLESCIRTALASGELAPDMERDIRDYAAQSVLSDRDQWLLSLLQDALAEGCIRRLSSSRPCPASGIIC